MDFQRSLSRILPSPDRLAQVKQFTQGASDEGVDPGITGARDSKQLKLLTSAAHTLRRNLERHKPSWQFVARS